MKNSILIVLGAAVGVGAWLWAEDPFGRDADVFAGGDYRLDLVTEKFREAFSE